MSDLQIIEKDGLYLIITYQIQRKDGTLGLVLYKQQQRKIWHNFYLKPILHINRWDKNVSSVYLFLYIINHYPC